MKQHLPVHCKTFETIPSHLSPSILLRRTTTTTTPFLVYNLLVRFASCLLFLLHESMGLLCSTDFFNGDDDSSFLCPIKTDSKRCCVVSCPFQMSFLFPDFFLVFGTYHTVNLWTYHTMITFSLILQFLLPARWYMFTITPLFLYVS